MITLLTRSEKRLHCPVTQYQANISRYTVYTKGASFLGTAIYSSPPPPTAIGSVTMLCLHHLFQTIIDQNIQANTATQRGICHFD